MFPVGLMNKSEVKKIALDIGFEELVKKKESVGICFIGDRYFQNFISEYIAERPGSFIDYDTGEIVGNHDGIHNWTVGQRCRLAGCLKPYFVLRKDSTTHTIYVVCKTFIQDYLGHFEQLLFF